MRLGFGVFGTGPDVTRTVTPVLVGVQCGSSRRNYPKSLRRVGGVPGVALRTTVVRWVTEDRTRVSTSVPDEGRTSTVGTKLRRDSVERVTARGVPRVARVGPSTTTSLPHCPSPDVPHTPPARHLPLTGDPPLPTITSVVSQGATGSDVFGEGPLGLGHRPDRETLSLSLCGV